MAAPLGEPFASVSGTCVKGDVDENFTGAPVSGRHPEVLVAYEVKSGAGELDFNDVQSGDTVWDTRSGFEHNDLPRVNAGCYDSPTNLEFVATYYDRPSTPSTFRGVGSAGEIEFDIPGEADYVADVEVTSGRLEVVAGSRIQQFGVGRSEFQLGRRSTFGLTLNVAPVGGTRPAWSVSVRALPTTITGVGFSRAFISSDWTTSTLRFLRSGDMSLDVEVADRTGAVVRSLQSGYGEYPWDGTDGLGRPVPDGAYVATVNGTDPAGHRSSGAASVVVDRTKPLVSVLSARRIVERQQMLVAVNDLTSGIQSAQLWAAGVETKATAAVAGVLALRPPGGWEPGTQAVYVEVEDVAGNDISLRHEFEVVKEQRCDRTRARAATFASKPTLVALRRAKLLKKAGTKGLRVAQVLCTDVDGDGVPEMVALLRGAKSRPALVAFSMSQDTWRLRLRETRQTFTRVTLRNGVVTAHRRGGRKPLTLAAVGAALRLR